MIASRPLLEDKAHEAATWRRLANAGHFMRWASVDGVVLADATGLLMQLRMRVAGRVVLRTYQAATPDELDRVLVKLCVLLDGATYSAVAEVLTTAFREHRWQALELVDTPA